MKIYVEWASKIIMGIPSLISLFIGFVVFDNAKTYFDQVEGLIIILIGSVLLSGALIFEAICHFASKLESFLKTINVE